jgi:hypothetical protein
MKIQGITAGLLSFALIAGCSRQGSETAQTTDGIDNTPTVSPNRDAPADRPSSAGARSTTGSGPAPPSAPRMLPPPERNIPAPPPAFRDVTLPAGTALPLELTTALSTETASVEMPISARLRQSVMVDGVTVLPAGAVVEGEVTEVDQPGRVKGRATLAIRFTSVTVGNTRENLRTNPVSFQGEASKSEDATKIGAGAGIGAVIGGIFGGGDGAAKGAAIGGAAGTGAVLATRGRHVSLPVGTDIAATLANNADIRVSNR